MTKNSMFLEQVIRYLHRHKGIGSLEKVPECKNECYACQGRKLKTSTQIIDPLPTIRLKKTLQTFAIVSLDYGGPFITIQGRGMNRTKRYLCLFTCLLSRASSLYGDGIQFRHRYIS